MSSSTRCRSRSPSYDGAAFREQLVDLPRRPLSTGTPAVPSRAEARRLSAPLLSRAGSRAAGMKPISTRSPGWSASRSRLTNGYVLNHRLRIHARGIDTLSRRHADGLPPPHRARRRARRSRRARHHCARELHRARGVRRPRSDLRRERFETLAQTLLAAGEADQFAAAHRRGRRAETAPPDAAEDCVLFGMGETFRVLLQRKSGGKEVRKPGEECLKNEKGPGNRGLGVNLFACPLQGAPKLLLLLRSSFLLRGGFLGCALHRLILPNIKFCDWKIAM